MKAKWSWRMVYAVRLSLILLVLTGGALLLRSEIAKAEELDRQIQTVRSSNDQLIQEGDEARKFFSLEESKLIEVEQKIKESIPEEISSFKGFFLEEAEKETLQLTGFRCEKPSTQTGRNLGKNERTLGYEKKKESGPSSEFEEIPFICQGNGSYGAILRFSDRIHSSKVLVAIDRFGISRTSLFSSLFPESRRAFQNDPKGPKVDPNVAPELHSFFMEGRIFTPAPKEKEEKEKEK